MSCQPLGAVDPVSAAGTVTNVALDGNARPFLIRTLDIEDLAVVNSEEMTTSTNVFGVCKVPHRVGIRLRQYPVSTVCLGLNPIPKLDWDELEREID